MMRSTGTDVIIRPDRRYAGVLLLDRSGRFILQGRNDGDGEILTTFGGGVEPGEADIDAALREIREELGANLSRHELLPLVAVPKLDANGLIHCQYYIYLVPLDAEVLHLAEGDSVVLLDPERAGSANVPLTATARIALEQWSRWKTRTHPLTSDSPGDRTFVEEYARSRYLSVNEALAWTDVLKVHCLTRRTTLPERVLDLGTGTGRFLPLLHSSLAAKETVGLDPSPAMARRAALTGHSIVRANAGDLPFRSNTFDVVWSSLVWHHLVDSAASCRETYRVLSRIGGQLLLRTAFVDRSSTGALFEYFPSALGLQMARYPVKKELLGNLEDAGFSDITHSRLEIPVAESFADYVQKVRSRAYSILWALEDSEYAKGLAEMERDQRLGRTGPVVLPGDLVVATKDRRL